MAAGAPSQITSDAARARESGCSSQSQERSALAGRGLRLEYLTVGWNVLEGVVAVTAALLAGSVVLLGFGIDSFIECASAFVVIWRLRPEALQRSAQTASTRSSTARAVSWRRRCFCWRST